MPRKPLNRSLHAAKATKQDEFYTQLSDIEKELVHYKRHFKNKTVLCNCDDPRVSNFFKYFLNNFEVLHLKRLITTCYQNDKPDLFSQHKSDNFTSAIRLTRTLGTSAIGMPRKRPLMAMSSGPGCATGSSARMPGSNVRTGGGGGVAHPWP